MSDGGYRSIEVYRIAHELGVRLHGFSLALPRHEQYEIAQQLRRASKSISANIVEGYGRREYKADYLRFLTMAFGSCLETTEWLEYVRDCHPGHRDAAVAHLSAMDELGAKLNRFIQAVERNHQSRK